MLTALASLALAAWLGLLLTPWQAWRNRERIEASLEGPLAATALADLSILIPARNEAAGIARTLDQLRPLLAAGAQILVVDDQSTDDTSAIARRWISDHGAGQGRLLAGQPPPDGWSGKLWALEQGLAEVQRPLVLLLDADIAVDAGLVAELHRHLRCQQFAYVSIMATLPVVTFPQKLLLPAFVWFFRMLYPFALANDSRSSVAAAAGGCILVRRSWLVHIGGYQRIRGQLIDDCALAAAIRSCGGRGWIGLSQGVRSHRGGPGRGESWAAIGAMIARNAFTQLHRSWGLLGLCSVVMVGVFLGPWLGLLGGHGVARALGATALGAMLVGYLPVLRFYQLSPLWGLALPVTGMFYLAMTWWSALGWLRGRQSSWRGRVYQRRFDRGQAGAVSPPGAG